ncbi:metallophosphoesterase [Catalinimonas sp. 4WD22]|uniref:metallophosphoesterase n=1 Tax=Catalinimonas locisalis TaxID=3133978 RepID=UPI003100EC1D
MNRRSFLKGTVAMGGLGLSTGLYTWQVEPFWLEFVQLKMPIRHLPDTLEGKRLMQISDIHVGNRFDRNYLIDSFREAQKLAPDYVVYTGDFVSYESEEQLEQLKEVFAHAVRGKEATLGILGNHDYGYNWSEPEVAEKIVNILHNQGIEILRNAQASRAGLNFIGLDDYWGTNFNPSQVMEKVNPNQANIVLCHNPDVADEPVWNNYQSWILSGHTHGGQCKPPFLEPPMLPVKNRRYTAGKIGLEDGRTLYINRALGHLWQVRFNVRPEITLFTLEKA